MQCPVDRETLVMADRNGVEIDYCPKCRGVWLDRGELDKIIDRAGASPAAATPTSSHRAHQTEARQSKRDDEDQDNSRTRGKRRDSFLSDIFDF